MGGEEEAETGVAVSEGVLTGIGEREMVRR